MVKEIHVHVHDPRHYRPNFKELAEAQRIIIAHAKSKLPQPKQPRGEATKYALKVRKFKW